MKSSEVIMGTARFFCLLMLLSGAVYGSDFKYGIINGEHVRLRTNSDTNSPVVCELMTGELVSCISRTEKIVTVGSDAAYWYNVETRDGKKGWAFGKYIRILDLSDREGKVFSSIIDDYLLSHNGGKFTVAYDDVYVNCLVKMYSLDSNYNVFYYESYVGKSRMDLKSDGRFLSVFRAENGKLELVIKNNDIISELIDDYIITANKASVNIYDPLARDKYNLYKQKDRLFIRDKLHYDFKGSFVDDSYVEFDEKSHITTMYLRYKKNEPYTIEKYKIDKGHFVQIEDGDAKTTNATK
jgi:hypothetical protein